MVPILSKYFGWRRIYILDAWMWCSQHTERLKQFSSPREGAELRKRIHVSLIQWTALTEFYPQSISFGNAAQGFSRYLQLTAGL
mmetsp:Transcript_34896/g.65718  ORF Transcript_34896/g.65718 Transcript_34896/m.65718 type:complete len:84 (+) Transcript_34896:2108-2359(+)